MSVKPELAFDVCWEVYRGAREVLETKRGISALNWKDTGKFLWRPDFRPRLNEWVADFALAGKAALDGPDWASRMVLFRLYYLGLAPYESAAHFHTARAPGSRGGTAPCVKPSPAHPARPSPRAQNPPPTRSIWDGSPAATGTSPCPSSSAPKCRASSPALRARRGTLPSTHQTPAPV